MNITTNFAVKLPLISGEITVANGDLNNGMQHSNAGSRCIVHGCLNHKHQGAFVGDLCRPCHQYLTTGRIGPTASFLGKLVYPTQPEEGFIDG